MVSSNSSATLRAQRDQEKKRESELSWWNSSSLWREMVLSTNSSHDEWDPARPLKYVSVCEASAAMVWASSDNSVKTSKWLWSRVYHCWVINVLNLRLHRWTQTPCGPFTKVLQELLTCTFVKDFVFTERNYMITCTNRKWCNIYCRHYTNSHRRRAKVM